MTKERSLAMIRYLSCLRDYPSTAEGVARLAAVLREHAVSEACAREVLSRFEETCPTPKQIRETAMQVRGIRNPETSPQFPTYGEKPAIVCVQCQDAGTFTPEGKTETVWCNCEQAEKIKAEMPDWVEQINKIARMAPKKRRA